MNNRKEPKQFDDGCSDFFDRYLKQKGISAADPKELITNPMITALGYQHNKKQFASLLSKWIEQLKTTGVNSKKTVREEMEEILKSLE